LAPDDKAPPPRPPPNGVGKSANKRDESTPSLDDLDSAWSEGEFDDEATMVAKVRHDLVELSRRDIDTPRPGPAAAKNETITTRPPPGEASVVIDSSVESMVKVEVTVDVGGDGDAEGEDDDEDEDELDADALDAGWDIEEERAVAADVAAGLDPEARRKAAEERAEQRKDKMRAKKLAAKEKRKAKTDAIRQKQKKPKKRSNPPPGRSTPPPPSREDAGAPLARERERETLPPAEVRPTAAAIAARRSLNRMVFLVALVVLVGALVIGLARR
jgi:hypothetical protein